MASAPPPPVTPTPTPTPTPNPAASSAANPLSTPPAGITSSTALTTMGALQSVRWDADANAYELKFDGYSNVLTKVINQGDFAQVARLIAPDGSELPYAMQAWTGFSYTRFGYLSPTDASANGPGGSFAFGLATLPGGVPTTGAATYAAQIDGHAGGWGLYGTAQFQFDFGAGTLSGFMDPHTNGPMESPGLPRYNFTQTVFSPGSTTFSGSFDVQGPTPSSFEGRFTGPNAEELMASFTAPFRDWDENEEPTKWGVMQGVIVGKQQH